MLYDFLQFLQDLDTLMTQKEKRLNNPLKKMKQSYFKESQKAKKKEPTKWSNRMKSSGLAFATSAKSNLPQDPIFIDKDEEETLDLTPLQNYVPHSKKV